MLGDLIYNARHDKNLTLEELAHKLGSPKLSRMYLSSLEKGKEIPSPRLLFKICSVLDIDLKEASSAAREAKIQRYKIKLCELYRN